MKGGAFVNQLFTIEQDCVKVAKQKLSHLVNNLFVEQILLRLLLFPLKSKFSVPLLEVFMNERGGNFLTSFLL